MTTLYIDRQGTRLHTAAGVLHIETPDGTGNRRLPIKYLDRVVLRADTQLSSRVLCALAEGGSSLLALGGRGGQQIAQMTGAPHGDARRRWQQVLTLSQPQACAAVAQGLIHAKTRRQLSTLAHMAEQRPDLRKPMHDAQMRLQRTRQSLAETTPETTLATLRGIEGAAAAAYFEAYFSAFAPALGAGGRNRRPPRDPVNAVLSLTYTLLHSLASNACWRAGLDPALGALHVISHGRAALACDLMEPQRPLADRWVWEQFRQEILRPEHFGLDGAGACLLGKAGRGHFYAAWEQVAKRFERSLVAHARLLAKRLDAAGAQASQTWAHLHDDADNASNGSWGQDQP